MERKTRKQRIYAVYDDDVFVDIGTKKENLTADT